MRLKEYLNESINIDTIWNILQKDCKPFLNELSKCDKYLFFRGMNTAFSISKKKVRSDRLPTDTPVEIHEYLDNTFYKKFGWKVRSNGLFVSASENTAHNYGNPMLIFPIGMYKYVWSPKIEDLYDYIGGDQLTHMLPYLGSIKNYVPPIWLKINWHTTYNNGENGTWEYDGKKIRNIESAGNNNKLLRWIPELSYEEYKNMKFNEIKKDFINMVEKAIGTYKINDLNGALITKNEVVFKCKEYYAIRPMYYDELIKLIWSK